MTLCWRQQYHRVKIIFSLSVESCNVHRESQSDYVTVRISRNNVSLGSIAAKVINDVIHCK